jgi:multidrug efflux pump subunit AcrA (membrane-fusion protein)
MIIKRGCDCAWCEAVSWDIVGELRDTIEKLQQSLMMRGTCRHTGQAHRFCRPPHSASRRESALAPPPVALTRAAPLFAEVDRAELEALLQVKIEVSTDLREKLRSATEDIVDLRKQIHDQQEKIAHLDLVRFLSQPASRLPRHC